MVSVICALAAYKNVYGGVVLLDSFINILVSDGNLTLNRLYAKTMQCKRSTTSLFSLSLPLLLPLLSLTWQFSATEGIR